MAKDDRREADVLDAYSRAVNEAAERVGPAVVKIETVMNRTPRTKRASETPQGIGSGVIFDSSGEILTNAHVVRGASRIAVTLPDGRKFVGAVVGADAANDLAVVRIGGQHLPVAELNAHALKIGQLVVAVGNPLGLGWSVTAGVVSALGRELQIERNIKLTNLIQTDTPINPGSSGGPLVDSRGRIVGTTTAMVQFAQGIGFAVPTTTALSVIAKIVAARRGAMTPALGVGGMRASIEEWVVTKNKLRQREGMLVLEVKPHSPAEQASLKPLDIIIEADGRAVKNPQDLAQALKQRASGERVTLGFLRDGTRRRVAAILNGVH